MRPEHDIEDTTVLCEYAQGTSEDPALRDPTACPKVATVITEEGYRWCQEHAEIFYTTVDILDGKPA